MEKPVEGQPYNPCQGGGMMGGDWGWGMGYGMGGFGGIGALARFGRRRNRRRYGPSPQYLTRQSRK